MEAAQGGRRAQVPAIGERVWRVFWRLDARRSGNGYSAHAISPTEIEAWCRLFGVTLRGWELLALDEMEQARLRWLNRDEDGEPVVVSEQPVTPDLVQALFG